MLQLSPSIVCGGIYVELVILVSAHESIDSDDVSQSILHLACFSTSLSN